MIRCIDCDNVLIKPHPAYAGLGLGRCSKEDFATFYSLTKKHNCIKFSEAKQDIIKLRMNWYDNKFGR